MNEEQEKHICENPRCGKEHDGSYGSGRFCSAKCKNTYNFLKVSKEKKLKHLNNLHQKLRAPFGRWRCTDCDYIAVSERDLSKHIRENHKDLHGLGWAKGLTKETDSRIKWGTTFSEKIKNGEIVPSFLGKHHSTKTKEKISKKQSENIENGKKFGTRKDVLFYQYKNLNGEDFLVRGTWELNVAKQLNSKNILWTRNKKIEYQDLNGNKHIYTPDFYLPETDEYIEVKGLFPEEDKQKMDLVKEQHPEKRIYFICKKNYRQFIKGMILLSDEILY